MGRTVNDIDVKWLDLRIAAMQEQVQHEKNQVEKSEQTGLNTSTNCRNLAITTRNLEVLKARKTVVLNQLNFKDSTQPY